jgi:hypothetical protein
LDFATQNAHVIATDKDEAGLAETLTLAKTGNIQSFILDVSNKAAIG